MRILILACFLLVPAGAYAQGPAAVDPDRAKLARRLQDRPVARELAGPPVATGQNAPRERADPVGNGIAAGALLGAGAGLAVMAAMYAQCDGTCDAPEPAPMYVGAAAFGAGAGALVGWLVDAARKSDSRVRVTPVVTPRRQAVRFAVRF